MLSELCYYLHPEVLRDTLDREVPLLKPGTTVVAAHWRHPVAEYPMTGDYATDIIAATSGLHHLGGYRDADVIIEVFDTSIADVCRRTNGCAGRLAPSPGGLVGQYFSLALVVCHRRGTVELVGGLGVTAQPDQQLAAHARQQIRVVEAG